MTRLLMRVLMTVFVIVVVLGAVLAATGVLHVRNSDDESGVTIDKKELNQKTQEAVEKTENAGSKFLDKTGEALHKAAEGLRKPSDDRNAPASTPRLNDKNTPQPGESKPSSQGPRVVNRVHQILEPTLQ